MAGRLATSVRLAPWQLATMEQPQAMASSRAAASSAPESSSVMMVWGAMERTSQATASGLVHPQRTSHSPTSSWGTPCTQAASSPRWSMSATCRACLAVESCRAISRRRVVLPVPGVPMISRFSAWGSSSSAQPGQAQAMRMHTEPMSFRLWDMTCPHKPMR